MYKSLTYNLYNIFYLLKIDLLDEISFLGIEDPPLSSLVPVLTIGTSIKVFKSFKIEGIDFSLPDTPSLNARKMRDPDKYLHDSIEQARNFLQKFEHNHVVNKILNIKCA